MKFAHLVQVNDPLNPLIETLSRNQLWRGLVLRAEAPKIFMPHLDKSTIINKTEHGVERELHYGEVTVRDSVSYLPQQQVIYQVPAQDSIPASKLTMTIEEPEPDFLFVRFEYEDDTVEEAGSEESFFNEFRYSAYKQADIDTIGMIRRLAEDGQFDD